MSVRTLPLVSICIPVRNRPEMLRSSLSSAMAQTYPNLEIVVCDNASTDSTADVARELAATDPRVRVYVNERDVGGFNYPMTVRHSTGELIQFLNSDDVLAADCVERLVSAIDRPGVVMAFCKASFMDHSGTAVEPPRSQRLLGATGDQVFDGQALADRMLALNANLLGWPTQVLWRRSAMNRESMGLGGRGWRTVGDISHWLVLLGRGDAAYVDEPLAALRLHDSQEQARARFPIERAFDWLELAERASRHGFLRRQSDQCAATTIALRQLAWRFEAGMPVPEAKALLHGASVALSRLRVHRGGRQSLETILGKTNFLYFEEGDGQDAGQVAACWLRAFEGRRDVRLVIAAPAERLSSVRKELGRLRSVAEPSPLLECVEDYPIDHVQALPGPVIVLSKGVSVTELQQALPDWGLEEGAEPWADPAIAAMSAEERLLRQRTGPPRWAA